MPGRVLVRAPHVEGSAPLSLEIRWPNARWRALQVLGEGIERVPSGYLSSPLMPGSYLLVVNRKGCKTMRIPFVVRDSTTDILELPELGKKNLRLCFDLPPSWPTGRLVSVVIRGRRGLARDFQLNPMIGRSLRLPEGPYEILVGDGDPVPTPVDLGNGLTTVRLGLDVPGS